MDETQSIFLNSLLTTDKLNQSKKILKFFTKHINKVVDAIDSNEINHTTLEFLINTIDTYYKKYNINIYSSENESESEDTTSSKGKNSSKNDEEEDEEEEDEEEEDEEDEEDDNEDRGNKDNCVKKSLKKEDTTTSSISLESDDSDDNESEDEKNNKKDILLEPFLNEKQMFKKGENNIYDINENIKTFISNSYVY
jgi:hypothetical protein